MDKPERTRVRLDRLSEMSFMLFLWKARNQLTKDGDIGRYETIREKLYEKRNIDIAKYVKGYWRSTNHLPNKQRQLLPLSIDKKNPDQMTINYVYYVIKSEYREIYERLAPPLNSSKIQ
jgi:hypothetical protein